jgi:hypothetical protein
MLPIRVWRNDAAASIKQRRSKSWRHMRCWDPRKTAATPCIVVLVVLLVCFASGANAYEDSEATLGWTPEAAEARAKGHKIVYGGPPCTRSAYLAPTPPSVAAFQSTIEDGPNVYLVRVRNESYLECRTLGSTWEKLIVTFKNRIRITEYNMQEEAAEDVVEYLALTGVHDLPYLRVYHARRPPTPPSNDDDDHDDDDRVVAECGEGTATGASAVCGHALLTTTTSAGASMDATGETSARPEGKFDSVILRGRGTSFSEMMNAINRLIEGAEPDAEGFALKKSSM